MLNVSADEPGSISRGVWSLLLLTMANAVVATVSIITSSTVAGLLSCSALSIGTIGLAMAHIIRSSRPN